MLPLTLKQQFLAPLTMPVKNVGKKPDGRRKKACLDPGIQEAGKQEGHFCISFSPKRFALAIKGDEICVDFLVPGLAMVPTILYPP